MYKKNNIYNSVLPIKNASKPQGKALPATQGNKNLVHLHLTKESSTLEGMTNLFTTHTPSQEQQWNISCSLPPLSTLMPLQVHKIICSFQDPRQSVQPTPNTKGHVSPHSILDKVIHKLAISSHMKQTEKMIRPTRYKKLCKYIQFYLEGQSILIT